MDQTRPTTAISSDAADSAAVALEATAQVDQATFETLVTQARDVFILAVRDFFQNDPRVPATLRFNDDETQNRIFISSESPQSIRLFPCVKVQAGPAQQANVAFGKFAEKAAYVDPISLQPIEYRRRVGKYRATWNLVCVSRDTLTRDRVADFTIDALEFAREGVIQQNGVIFIPNTLRLGQDDILQWDQTTPLFRKVVSVDTWLEWFHDETIVGPILNRIYSRSTFSQGPAGTGTATNPEIKQLAPK